MEGRVFRKAPDGRILISAEGFESWVETSLGSVRSQKHRTKSPSPIKESNAAKGSSSSSPPLDDKE
jgi:hypothetical protein